MKINLNVKFNMGRKYVINGKEYGSVEEMPADIRQTYEKATGSVLESTKKKIVFNGKEYENVEAMPSDVRQMYDDLVKMVEMQRTSPDAAAGKPNSFGFSKPTTPEPAVSPRLLLFIIMLIVFLGILYFFYRKSRGF